MISIKNDIKVDELYYFIHPKYQDYQMLYFNKNADVMIEWLSHNRVLLYVKQVIGYDSVDDKLI